MGPSSRRLLASLVTLTTFVVLSPVGAQDNPTTPVQDPASAKPAAPTASTIQDAPPEGAMPRRDLASRLKLLETYQLEQKEGSTGLVQYQVAFRESMHTTHEVGQAAPKSGDYSWNGRFTERAAELSPVDNRMVSAVVRRYDAAGVTPDPWSAAGHPSLAKDLTVWIKDLGGLDPHCLVLTPNRGMYEQEFQFVMGGPYLPMQAMILPEQYVHIGESWTLTRLSASTLVTEAVIGGALTAKLAKVEPISDPNYPGANERAFIDVEGRVQTPKGQSSLRARIEFTYHETASGGPQPGEAATPTAGGDAEKKSNGPQTPNATAPSSPVCVGGISKIRLAQLKTFDNPGPDQPTQIRRELVVERRWPAGTALLAIPDPIPQPTVENTWLTHLDPKLLFSIKHPPTYIPHVYPTEDGGSTFTLDRSQYGGEVEHIELTIRSGAPPKPETAFQTQIDEYKQVGHDALDVDIKLLPPADWAGRQVYRVETAFTPQNDLPPAGRRQATRTHFDGYVLMVPENYSVTANAVTTTADASAFRTEAEAILKTFVLRPQFQQPEQNLPR